MALQNVFATGAGADPSFMQRLTAGLYSPENIDSFIARKGKLPAAQVKQMQDVINSASANPIGGQPLAKGISNTGLGTTTNLGWNWIKDHKLKSAGMGALGAMNIAGLLDNPYWGGQVAGGALGGAAIPLIASKLGHPLATSTAILAGLTGGGLGSLFDKLRAKQAEEEMYQGQY